MLFYFNILDHKDMFLDAEESRGTVTRSESSFDKVKDTLLCIAANYIDNLWEGIEERLQYFDSDGTTSWSETQLREFFFLFWTLFVKKKHLSNFQIGPKFAE